MGKKSKKRREARRAALRAKQQQTLWGLLDTKDNLWLGDGSAPKLFDDESLAQAAARIIDVRLGWPAGRTRATKYDKHGKKRDEIKPHMSGLAALQRLEEGKVL
jgi:hypothetical protein